MTVLNSRAVPRLSRPVEAPAAPVSLQVFAVAVLVLATGAFFAVESPLPPGESRPAVLALWALAYLVAAAVLLDGRLRSRTPVHPPVELLVFLGLALLSVTWSEAPGLTLRRSVGLVGTCIVALLLAQRLGAELLLRCVRIAMSIVAVSSLLLYASGSAAALDDTFGTLRGVVATKNTLGFLMALGLVACAAGGVLGRTRVRASAVSALPMLLALSLTDSKTGLVITVFVAIAAVVALLRRRRRGAWVVAAVALLLAAATSVLAPFASLAGSAALIGEDTTLTGRDAIWQESLKAIRTRPLLGHGYGAFWTGTDAGAQIKARLLWDVPHAHNGALEVLLDLGVVGLVAAVAIVLALVVRGLVDLNAGRHWNAILRLTIALLLLLSNLVESNFLQQNSLLAVLLVAALSVDSSRTPGVRLRPGGRSPAAGGAGTRAA